MIGLHSFWRTDALWDCVKIGACSIFWRMRKIACVFTHAIWTVLLNNVCCIYFCRRMRKSHAIIRSEKIATHPIWMYPKTRSEILRDQRSDNQYQISRSENPEETRVGAMFSWQYREVPFHSSDIIRTLVVLSFTRVTYSEVVLKCFPGSSIRFLPSRWWELLADGTRLGDDNHRNILVRDSDHVPNLADEWPARLVCRLQQSVDTSCLRDVRVRMREIGVQCRTSIIWWGQFESKHCIIYTIQLYITWLIRDGHALLTRSNRDICRHWSVPISQTDS